VLRFRTLKGTVERLVLGDQHANGDPGHVQTVQDVLDSLVHLVLAIDHEASGALHSLDGLGHSGNNVLMS